MGAGVCSGNPRALCCSRFTAGVHPSPCWLGAPIIPGMVPYLIKITPCIPSLHNLLCILQDAWKGPVLLGGHSGVLSPTGTPVLLACPCWATGEHSQAPAGCVGSPPPLLPPRILLAVYLAGHVRAPPHCQWGQLFWARGDVRGGRVRAAVLPSAPAPLLCGWESRALRCDFFTHFVLQLRLQGLSVACWNSGLLSSRGQGKGISCSDIPWGQSQVFPIKSVTQLTTELSHPAGPGWQENAGGVGAVPGTTW